MRGKVEWWTREGRSRELVREGEERRTNNLTWDSLGSGIGGCLTWSCKMNEFFAPIHKLCCFTCKCAQVRFNVKCEKLVYITETERRQRQKERSGREKWGVCGGGGAGGAEKDEKKRQGKAE